jgi:hypothetical protein
MTVPEFALLPLKPTSSMSMAVTVGDAYRDKISNE